MPKFYLTQVGRPCNPFFDPAFDDENIAIQVADVVAEREGNDFIVFKVEPVYSSQVPTVSDDDEDE